MDTDREQMKDLKQIALILANFFRISINSRNSRHVPIRVHPWLTCSTLWLYKWRDGAIQRIGNRAEKFGFGFLDNIIGGHDLGAGGEDVLFDLGRRHTQLVQRHIEA